MSKKKVKDYNKIWCPILLYRQYSIEWLRVSPTAELLVTNVCNLKLIDLWHFGPPGRQPSSAPQQQLSQIYFTTLDHKNNMENPKIEG